MRRTVAGISWSLGARVSSLPDDGPLELHLVYLSTIHGPPRYGRAPSLAGCGERWTAVFFLPLMSLVSRTTSPRLLPTVVFASNGKLEIAWIFRLIFGSWICCFGWRTTRKWGSASILKACGLAMVGFPTRPSGSRGASCRFRRDLAQKLLVFRSIRRPGAGSCA